MKSNSALREIKRQIDLYFKGQLKKFDIKALGLSSDLRELDGTVLQKEVWKNLLDVPYGKTITYKELAKMVGTPKAIRPVASAVAKNPLHIVVPCHRVLPSNPKRKGDVGEYAGGKNLKRCLLDLEAYFS